MENNQLVLPQALKIVDTSFTRRSGSMGSSMFSRNGRSTIHDYMIFSSEEKRLRYCNSSYDPGMNKEDPLYHLIYKEPVFEKITEKKNKKRRNRKFCSNYLFNVVSRNKTSSAINSKPNTPKLGKYSPNYESVDRKSFQYSFCSTGRSSGRVCMSLNRFCSGSTSLINP
ncbi:unnamed protein product [Moneuplotes crassus]|uniref:Uncharacterized protein n=1 Tax=Euplotes crassus TaxID=5936 RepID=A0AAD1UI52_EUPCR|nr:unnamed protein product [Moneuplotes crassus]